MIKERNLDPTLRGVIKGDIIPGAAEKHYICKAAGAQNAYWQTRVPEFNFHTTIAQAYAAMTTGQGDVAYLSCDSHTQTAALTWVKNMSHMVGMYGPAYMNQRARIGCSGNFIPMLTVSGYGNTFANLYWMYGTGAAANLNLLTVSGNRNTFINNHFGCFNATELDEANFDLVRLNAAETYFKNCTFGQDSVLWTNGNMIEFWAGAEPPRAVFEDCIFQMNADNAQVTFLKFLAGCGGGLVYFKNCIFANCGTSLTYAIDGAGLGNMEIVFDINCTFAGVDDIVAASYESTVWAGHGGYVSADLLNNMIATHPDVS
jgi:hypothetical protein